METVRDGIFLRTASFDLLEAAAGEYRAIQAGAFDVPRWIGVFVAALDEQPALTALGFGRTLAGAHQAETAAQLGAVEVDVDLALRELLLRRNIVVRRVVGPGVPDITVPAPYWPSGITPSNSAYSSGWSSVRMARRLSAGFMEGPFGSAQDTSTPWIANRKS